MALFADLASHAPYDCEGDTSTFGSFGECKLSLLCNGLAASRSESEQAVQAFRLLSRSWHSQPLGTSPVWPSDITDDGTPFEFSVAFDGCSPRIRILAETQGSPITPCSSWVDGLALNKRLCELPNVNLDRFDRVRDLFAPVEDLGVRFALWHAADIHPVRGTSYKVYLNPQVRGPHSARDIVGEALDRLGADRAAKFLRQRLPSTEDGTRLAYFSLDLSTARESRIKVYVTHPGITARKSSRCSKVRKTTFPEKARGGFVSC